MWQGVRVEANADESAILRTGKARAGAPVNTTNQLPINTRTPDWRNLAIWFELKLWRLNLILSMRKDTQVVGRSAVIAFPRMACRHQEVR